MAKNVTRADMEAAGERIAARDGITVEDVRERVRRGSAIAGDDERTCDLDGCDRTFTPTNARHRYCTTSHRAAAHRERTGGAS